MAYISNNNQNASSYSNVTLTVGVELSSCTRSEDRVTITYRVYGVNPSGNWSKNSIAFWYGDSGARHVAFDNTRGSSNVHTTIGTYYYGGYQTQTFNVGRTTSSFSFSVGVSQVAWNPNGPAGYLTFNVAGVPTATSPSGVSVSSSNITRTSATLSGSYSSIGSYASFSSESYQYGTSGSYGSYGKSLSGLTPNTTYYYKYTVTNTAGLSASATGSLKTSGNAPSITSIDTSPSRTGCSFSINVNYDTNDGFSSRTIEYGTSTSYGSSTSGTEISNLTPNTVYYYKVTINSNQGRSSSSTGSFTTTGNAPSISAVKASSLIDSCSFDITAEYDTNASFSSLSIEYGTSDSYGSSSTSSTINNLAHNTLYYYKIAVTDNWSRTSNYYAERFVTKGLAPTIVSASYENLTSKSIDILLQVTFDVNTGLKFNYCDVYLNGDLVQSKIMSGKNTIKIRNLKPGKLYTFRLTSEDIYGRVSDAVEMSVKTKGGFKFNGKMSDTIKINNKEVIGMKYNGIEII